MTRILLIGFGPGELIVISILIILGLIFLCTYLAKKKSGTKKEYRKIDAQKNKDVVTICTRQRSIPLSIIFTIITLGIYGIYWFININNDTNKITNHPEGTSGGLAFLFSIITFGIYKFYWYFTMGKRLKEYYSQKGSSECSEAPILYLLLGIFGIGVGGIINYCLIQNNINNILDSDFESINNTSESTTHSKDSNSSSTINFCCNCGAKLNKDYSFCPECGAKL